MGYRTYLGYLPKTSLTPTNVEEFPKREQTYLQLGKYVEWRPKSPDLIKDDEDHEFYIIDKDFLITIINAYCDFTHKYYKNILEDLSTEIETQKNLLNVSSLTPEDVNPLEHKIKRFFEERIRKWAREDVLGMSRNMVRINKSHDGQITPDWSYEYSVFNLVHILHTHDWEKSHLVYWCQ